MGKVLKTRVLNLNKAICIAIYNLTLIVQNKESLEVVYKPSNFKRIIILWHTLSFCDRFSESSTSLNKLGL